MLKAGKIFSVRVWSICSIILGNPVIFDIGAKPITPLDCKVFKFELLNTFKNLNGSLRHESAIS